MNHMLLKHAITLLMLSVNAWTDIRKKEIHLPVTMGAGLSGLLLSLLEGGIGLSTLAGFSIGGFLFCFSILTRGAVGCGDSIVLVSMACLLPWDTILISFSAALLLSALYSLFLLVVRKKDKKTGIAFVPFLLAGYLAALILPFCESGGRFL